MMGLSAAPTSSMNAWAPVRRYGQHGVHDVADVVGVGARPLPQPLVVVRLERVSEFAHPQSLLEREPLDLAKLGKLRS